MIVPSASTSGFVDRTTPVRPLRVGGGVDLLGGQVGEVHDPVDGLVECTRERWRWAAARRSGRFPGPSKWSASKRRSFSRVAAAASASARSFHAATGSGSSRRQTWAISSQSRSNASSGGRSGMDEPGPRLCSGHGTTVQFVVRSLITSRISLTNGSWSRPARSGSRSSSSPVVARPGERDPRRPLARRARASGSEPRRDEVEGVLGRVRDPGSLDVRVEVLDVDERRAAPVGASAIARANSYWPWSAPTVTIWPGWTLAANVTARSASRVSRRSRWPPAGALRHPPGLGRGLKARYQPTFAVGEVVRRQRRRPLSFLALAVGEVEVPGEIAALLGGTPSGRRRARSPRAARGRRRRGAAAVRRVARALEAVELDGDQRVAGRDLVDHEHLPAEPGHPRELGDDQLRTRDVVERPRAAGEVESAAPDVEAASRRPRRR